MNQIETEADAALAWEYKNVLADNGEQAESILIDGRPVLGNLSFDNDEIALVMGGTNENITAVLHTLKSQFPDGMFPQPLTSKARVTVDGRVQFYQVRQLNGDKDNRAQLMIGLGAFTNRK